MAKAHLKLVTLATVIRTLTPRRLPNGKLRTREKYLTEAEVERLMAAARGDRHGHRDAAMAFVACRHGLRAAELVDLRWAQVDFKTATLHTSAESRKALLPPTLFSGTSYGRYGDSSATNSPSHPSCSPRSTVHRSRLPASHT